MRRAEVIQLIDGTHPTRGIWVSAFLQSVIILSCLAISVETIPGLPDWMVLALKILELFALGIFAAEYLTRIICSAKPLHYIFSFWGIVDLLSCLPVLLFVDQHWAAIRTLRMLRLMRMLKLLHTNKALIRLELALQKSKGDLIVFGVLASIILYIAGVGIYIFEHDAQPEVFSSIPVSIWWAVVSFTTVGYGDMYPVTAEGRAFTSVILFIGLGVIAVPTAIITTALINTDFKERIEQEVEEDLRRDMKKDHSIQKRKPTRRP